MHLYFSDLSSLTHQIVVYGAGQLYVEIKLFNLLIDIILHK